MVRNKPTPKKNILDLYSLEDHDGNEITISEMIDKYLYNPELCFKEGWNEMSSFDGSPEITANHNTSYATQVLINHLHHA